MKKQLLFIAVGLLILASCKKSEEIAPTVATETAKTAMKGPKPFSGTMVYQPTNTFNLPCNCGSLIDFGTLSGTGNLTHLGLSSSKIKPCISFTPTGFHVGVECGSFVAANGDELYTAVTPYDLNYTPNGFSGSLHVNFAGGTGRFANATGGFDATLDIDFSNTATLTIPSGSGTINY